MARTLPELVVDEYRGRGWLAGRATNRLDERAAHGLGGWNGIVPLVSADARDEQLDDPGEHETVVGASLRGERGEIEKQRDVRHERLCQTVDCRRRLVSARRLERPGGPACRLLGDDEEERLFRRVVPVEGTLGDERAPADVVDRDGGVTATAEEREPGLDEPLVDGSTDLEARLGREQLVPHLRAEHPVRRLVEQVGQQFREQPADRLDQQSASFPHQANKPDQLDVPLVVEEAIGRHLLGGRQHSGGEVVADGGGRDTGPCNEFGHRELAGGRRGRGRHGSTRKKHDRKLPFVRLPGDNVPVVGHVRVITDSSACVPAELVAKFAVCVLPISVYLPEVGVPGIDPADGEGILPSEELAREELAGANHPFVTEYLQAIESPDFDAAVVITPAIEFATMYRNAALAAEFAVRPVVLIDARTAAAGQALVVLAAAEAAASGAEIEQVVRVVEEAASRVELVASLATLEPIRRSGPVPEDVLGDLEPSGERSVFRMRDGTVEPLGSAATAEEMLEAIRAAYLSSAPLGSARSAVFHANAPQLAERLSELLGGVDFISGFSVAMQVHTGGGVVGAAWIPAGAAP